MCLRELTRQTLQQYFSGMAAQASYPTISKIRDVLSSVLRSAVDVEYLNKNPIDRLGTHSLRHSYRSWLDAVETAIAVQQKLMRHSDIRTTLNIYGDVVTNEMAEAHAKIVRLELPRAS
jgi:integrase